MSTPADKDIAEVQFLIQEATRRGQPVPPELERELFLYEMRRRGINPWTTFRQYVEYLNGSLLQYEHVHTLVDAAEKVVSGEIKRLLVCMPPRYFKTEVFGRLLPSYFLRRNPHWSVGFSSYNAAKSWEESEKARSYFELAGGTLRPGAEAKKFWGPPEGGEMWAVGIREGTLGRGMHLGICDDPIDPDHVRSPIYQRRFQHWWGEKWLSRQAAGGVARLIVVMQRLAMDDPIDFLLRREVGENTEQAQENWHILIMDEIKSLEPLGKWSGPQGLPPSCTLIHDKRLVGEVLSPSLNSIEVVKKAQASATAFVCSSQRQQRPMSAAGDFWQKSWFQVYKKLPDDAYNGGKDWDTAYTKEEANSASAFVESYRGPVDLKRGVDFFNIYIEDVGWEWLEFPGLVKWMTEIAGPHYVEEKATGKSVVQSLAVYGIPATPVEVHGDKLARSAAAQPAVSNKRIWINELIYDKLLLAEGQGLLRVTGEALMYGRGALDVNDAFVQALHRHLKLSDTSKPRNKVRIYKG